MDIAPYPSTCVPYLRSTYMSPSTRILFRVDGRLPMSGTVIASSGPSRRACRETQTQTFSVAERDSPSTMGTTFSVRRRQPEKHALVRKALGTQKSIVPLGCTGDFKTHVTRTAGSRLIRRRVQVSLSKLTSAQCTSSSPPPCPSSPGLLSRRRMLTYLHPSDRPQFTFSTSARMPKAVVCVPEKWAHCPICFPVRSSHRV